MATMPPKVGVAPQGGGSHGAFTCAALDRLLQQSAIVIDSAGAFRARHPFRHEHWLFQHNGAIREFHRVKRDFALPGSY